jgi:hypothetical protein
MEMSEPGDRHREAAGRHDSAAERHQEAAAHWEAVGDSQRAQLERRNVQIERAAAQLERDCADLEDASADSPGRTRPVGAANSQAPFPAALLGPAGGEACGGPGRDGHRCLARPPGASGNRASSARGAVGLLPHCAQRERLGPPVSSPAQAAPSSWPRRLILRGQRDRARRRRPQRQPPLRTLAISWHSVGRDGCSC